MARAFTEEQDGLRASVRELLTNACPIEAVHRVTDDREPYDDKLWRRMSDMIGLPGLLVPEDLDGSGATFVDLCVALEETGRALAPSPLYSSGVLAVSAVIASGDAQAQQDLLPSLAAGTRTASFAVAEGPGPWSASGIVVAAEGPEWRLTGIKDHVVDGHTSDLVLVVARAHEGLALFVVEGDAAGMTRTPLETMDWTRRQARIELVGTPARLVGTVGQGEQILAEVELRAIVAQAAEQVGGMEQVLDMAVDYAKTRHQFGRAIGSFQAIKHQCADMLVDLERAKTAVLHAARAIDESADDREVTASVVKSFVSEVYFNATATNVAIHGGIGYTWEHSAHLYYRRAKASQFHLGAPDHHRARIMDRLTV